MKTIVIGDIHQRVDAVKSILKAETDYDEVVFLGDWFDSFYEPPKVAGMEETAEYLRSLSWIILTSLSLSSLLVTMICLISLTIEHLQ